MRTGGLGLADETPWGQWLPSQLPGGPSRRDSGALELTEGAEGEARGPWLGRRAGGHAVAWGGPPDGDVGARGGDDSRFKLVTGTDEMSESTWNSQAGRCGAGSLAAGRAGVRPEGAPRPLQREPAFQKRGSQREVREPRDGGDTFLFI